MEENVYQGLVAMTFRKIEGALDDVDPDLVEVTSTGDVVTLTLPKGVKCVINTQRPARQIWMAVKSEAWHFGYDAAKGRWLDDKGRDIELLSKVKAIVREYAGVDVAL